MEGQVAQLRLSCGTFSTSNKKAFYKNLRKGLRQQKNDVQLLIQITDHMIE
uniref:Uncharacterized protein n=1 Tax=Arundo donax TaxID=35708 RepID=A0A0A9FHS6_ARUDO